MAQVVLTNSLNNKAFCVKAPLTVTLLHEVAEAFTDRYSEDRLLQRLVHIELALPRGSHSYQWYCLDLSSTVWMITFSNAMKPRVYLFQGIPVAVASPDAASLRIYAQQVDLVNPGELTLQDDHPHFVSLE